MTHQQQSFRRKVIYLSGMALLLLPLSIWGLPARSQAARDEGPKPFLETLQGGRVLANLRYQHKLAQGTLGEIDPGSEAMKFGLLGFRGVFATFLWHKAREYKMKENWTAMASTLDQIAKLQPNFVGVWRYQGWNLSFNVSVEWDDYRYRYYWVVNGINYLDKGQKYNDRETRLMWDEAWFTGYKIGRSDEYLQFRELFSREHPPAMGVDVPQPSRKVDRDNWLYAKVGFEDALSLHENKNVPLRGMSPELFYGEPPKCQIRYTQALVNEGRFGGVARGQWKQALEEWREYGNRKFEAYPPAADGSKVYVSFLELDDWEKEAARLTKELDELGGRDEKDRTVRQQLADRKRERLPREQREILDKKPEDRTPQEQQTVNQLERQQLRVSHLEVANEMPQSVRPQARELAQQIVHAEGMIARVMSKRNVVNYEYWRTRCVAEGDPLMQDARASLFSAGQAYERDSGSPATRKAYDEAFAQWKEVIDKYPVFAEDGDVGEELIAEFRRYARTLKSLEVPFVQDEFILRKVIEERQPDPPIQ